MNKNIEINQNFDKKNNHPESIWNLKAPYTDSRLMAALLFELDSDVAGLEEIMSVSREVASIIASLPFNKVAIELVIGLINETLRNRNIPCTITRDEVTLTKEELDEIMHTPNKENGNVSFNPESINLTIAETVIKKAMHKNLFNLLPLDVLSAEKAGEIKIHDFGMFNRLYCSGHSIEYFKRHGIVNIPNIACSSSPAKSAYVLARHICSATQFLTGLFAGAIGFDAVNIFFAPMLRGMKYKEIYQLTQTMVFDFAQLAGAKGGQVSFSDFNLYTLVPKHYREVYAMGKGGCYMVQGPLGKIDYIRDKNEATLAGEKLGYKVLKYKDFEKESQLMCKAFLEIARKGDSHGMPFAFPKLQFHINEKVFTEPSATELLVLASQASAEKGCPYFVFDRDEFSVSQCCRLLLQLDEEDKKMMSSPEEIRFVGAQNVSINLPSIVLKLKYEYGIENPTLEDFEHELARRMELAAKAHIARTNYIKKLVDKENSPLIFYKSGCDKKPYVRFDKSTYLIGMVGLNEAIKNLIGKELHEDDFAYKHGVIVVTMMHNISKQLSANYGIKINLEETPAESTAGRFAEIDTKIYGENAFVQENEEGIYYTNSVHFSAKSDVDYVDRIIKQSKMHTLVKAGSIIHTFSNDYKPNWESIFNLVHDIHSNTKCVQWVYSPNQTVCHSCETTVFGDSDTCKKCGSTNVEVMARITGYYVPKSKFNKAKIAERKDRMNENIRHERGML